MDALRALEARVAAPSSRYRVVRRRRILGRGGSQSHGQPFPLEER
jgi:hypothetical protein